MNSKALSKILGLEPKGNGVKYKEARIYLKDINVLRQPRQTFDEDAIRNLSESIQSEGLINPILVVEHDAESCAKHLEALNLLWGTEYTMGDVKPVTGCGAVPKYYILIAGERRFRAMKLAFPNGNRKVRATVGTGERPVSALFKQLAENIHASVPIHEEADAYYRLFILIRKAKPSYPLAQFAKSVGRSASTLRNALRFCELPERIRKMVEDGIVPYGCAVQLARLKEAGLDEGELLSWTVNSAMIHSSVTAFKKIVDDFLDMRSSGQGELFSLSTIELEETRRKVVEEKLVRYIWPLIYYHRRLLALMEQGLLGGVYSPGSPIHLVEEMISLQEAMLPRLMASSTNPKRVALAEKIRALGAKVCP